VSGYDSHQYICEVPLSQVPYIIIEDRDFEYGIDTVDLEKIPRGPYFIQEPKPVVFDLSRDIKRSYVSLRLAKRCILNVVFMFYCHKAKILEANGRIVFW